MKIFTTSALLTALLASLAAAAAPSDDVAFNGTAEDADHVHNHTVKTAANLKGAGAQIQLCPSGDCTNGQSITLSMSRMEEIGDDAKNSVVQAAKNFNSLSAKWSAFEPYTVGGVDAMTTSCIATFTVGKAATATSFNLTAMIFQANGTAMNGNQTVDIPAGALKFSVAVKDWPFLNTTNQLRFGVELKAKGKGGKDQADPTKKGKAGKTHMDRVDMGEGMFMDAPTLAVIDDVTTPINSSVEVANKKTELLWVFPSFTKTLYYDPVMGTDPSASSTPTDTTGGTTTTTTPTTTPAATTAKPTSSASHIIGALAATVLAVAGACLV